ncbi:uncharacterized protein LOC132757829, partial [Ruditapes philippinarum]|uniref:uncharacterized protein LOC132757829 n=1 Tax=Ruditapes philippinarum TaxID=129788 RepID=UPI00295BE539
MATSDNERYLRYILLLGKGGPLVLKGILKREAQNVGKPLSQILLNNSGKLRQLIRNDSQYDRIFPSAGPVNDDLDNWDTSLLCLVILNIFRSSLTSKERADIRILRDFRNEIQGHSASLALSEGEYNEYRSDLIIVLLKFSSRIDRQYHDECQKLIKSTKSGPIEISSTLDDFKEFQTELLTLIKADFGANSIKLDDICKEIKKIQGTTVQQKELAEENHHRLCQMEQSQDEIRQKVEVTNVQQKELAEENRSYFCKMEMRQDELRQMLKVLLKRKAEASTNGNTDIQEDVETKLHAQSKNDDTASSAEDMLVQKINELLREVNSAPEPKTINEEHVRGRVQRYLQAKKLCPNDKELTLAVMELMIDVYKQSGTTILPADKCCIRFVVRCKSYTGLLGLLEYLESKVFDQRIQDITTALRKQTEISVFLTVVVSAHSLQRIKNNLTQNQVATGSCKPRNRTVTLPVRSRNIRSIEHVWKLFQEGDINSHLLNISRILSTIVGDNIEITSSINLKKLKQSLQNIESNTAHTSDDESKTVTSEEKLDKVSTCSTSDRDVANKQAHSDAPFDKRRQRQGSSDSSSSHSSEKSGSTDDSTSDRDVVKKQAHADAQFDRRRLRQGSSDFSSSHSSEISRSADDRESDKSFPRGSSYHEEYSRSSFKEIHRSRSNVKDSSAYSEKQREMSPGEWLFHFRHANSKKGKAQDQGRGADSNDPTLDYDDILAQCQKPERLRLKYAKALSLELWTLTKKVKSDFVEPAETKDDSKLDSTEDQEQLRRVERIAIYKEKEENTITNLRERTAKGESSELPSLFLSSKPEQEDASIFISKSFKVESSHNKQESSISRSRSMKQDASYSERSSPAL